MLRSIVCVLLAIFVLPSIAEAQGVVDLYIFAGQSNADGRGEVSDLTPAQLESVQNTNNTIISYVNPGSERERAVPTSTPPDLDVGSNGFVPLVPGGFSVDGTSARQLTPTFGAELSFGASIAEATGSENQIAIVKVSRGGTNLREDWDVDTTVNDQIDEPNGFLYRALLEHVSDSIMELEALGNTVNIEGFLWHQGESDSNAGLSEYTDNFLDFAAGVREEFSGFGGADIPFVLGELSRTRENSEGFNNNLPNIVSQGTGISIVSSEGLTTPANDTTHFDANGQIELGQRFAAAFSTSEPEPPNQTVLFDFRSTGGSGLANVEPGTPDFDRGNIGQTATVDGLGVTIVDVLVPEFEIVDGVAMRTGNIVTGGSTLVSGQDALGIDNQTVSNGEFEDIDADAGAFNNGIEQNDLNPDESLVLSFDEDIQFTSIELESFMASGGPDDDGLEIFVDGELILTNTDDGFIPLGGLAGLTIPAGTEVAFTATGSDVTTSFRIETFEVEIIPGATIPGDFDEDGDVDGNDFLLIQRTDPSLIPVWVEAFGGGAPLGALTAVPEPASLLLIFSSAVISLASRRRYPPLANREHC